PQSYFSHTLVGVLVFCVPTSLAAWALFESTGRSSLWELLPPGIRAATRVAAPRSSVAEARKVGLAAVAVLLGALTHIAWDSLTHQYGWGVSHIQILASEVSPTRFAGLRWYNVLQHGSTLVGLVVVFLWSRRFLAKFSPAARRFAPG